MKIFVLALVLLTMTTGEAKVKVHGHRGARAILPENTLVGFEYALKIGVDVLEMDLAVTKDNHLVVSHDPYINSDICLDSEGKKPKENTMIRSLSLKQVKSYDCGSVKNKRFPKQKTIKGEKIPTLDEVFKMVKASKHNKDVEFNIETKIFPAHPEITPTPEEFSKLVVELVQKHKLQKRTIIQSFDYRTLIEVKKLDASIRTSQLTYANLLDSVAVVNASKADILSPHYEWITASEVKRLHQNKLQVAPWTANDPKVWQKLVEMNVDAIITDDPEALIKFLKSQD
ncbi:MAG: glycerophosphodiester phosphodiesterase [Bdellovibrionales bacterium]|nr:glycerophosphodiester phosphodiesterase [Bdellovibrionales bacterium]